jgi:hypothetical protein
MKDEYKKMIVASKANTRAMAYYALAFKPMKLMMLITKAKTDEWPGGESWKVKKALMAKYRPDDVLAVSELKKRLNDVALKGNQDPSDMFEELAEIEHAFLETKSTLGSQDLIGAVFASAPEKYHSVLTITAELKGATLGIDYLESAIYKLWRQGGNQEVMMTITRLYCLLLLEPLTYANPKDTRQLTAPRKTNLAVEAVEVAVGAVEAVATNEEASSWDLAINVAYLVTGRGLLGNQSEQA